MREVYKGINAMKRIASDEDKIHMEKGTLPGTPGAYDRRVTQEKLDLARRQLEEAKDANAEDPTRQDRIDEAEATYKELEDKMARLERPA